MGANLSLDISLALLARIAPGLLSILAVPLYVRILGADQYGAVGLFMTVQMFVGLLDLGFSVAISREASWLTGHGASRRDLGCLLRTAEIFFWGMALVIAMAGFALGDDILQWIFGVDIAFVGLSGFVSALLFLAIAARFPFSAYYAHISGRGYVAQANLIILAGDSMRVVGTIGLLLAYGDSLALFFGWHALISVAMSFIGRLHAHRNLGMGECGYRFDVAIVRKLRAFAFGSSILTLLFVAANSLDKVLLPRFLSASDFGYYIVVSQLASTVFMVTHAIWGGVHPRMLIEISTGNSVRGRRIYSIAASLMTAVCAGSVIAASTSGRDFLALWIGSGVDASEFSVVLTVLVLGYSFAALSHLAFTIQHAVKSVLVSVLVLGLAVPVVPLLAYSVWGEFNPLRGGFAWSVIYFCLFCSGCITYLKHGRDFFGMWMLRICIPMALVVGVSICLGMQTPHMSGLAGVIYGVALGGVTASAILVSNREIRSKALAAWNGPDNGA